MKKPAFSPLEMEIMGSHISTNGTPGGPPPRYNTPITPKENLKACLRRDGSVLWIPHIMDFLSVESRANTDHIARGEVRDLGPILSDEEKGGPDLFGVPWVYVPQTRGSMVRPGSPVLTDANDWPDIIQFPDIDSLGWEECASLNAPLNASERGLIVTFQNGLFERLISFMDFEGAALAIIDEEQKDAVHALFARLCDMYETMLEKYMMGLHLDGIKFHDDWGSQRAPFFAPQVCREMIVPYLKRLADFCHKRGLWFEHHCCGKNELLVPCMIEAGVDMWFGQPMNDMDRLRSEYGDKIMLGVYPPSTDETMSDAEIDEIAHAFVQKYVSDMGTRPVVLFDLFGDKRLAPLVYKYSRIALAS